MLKQAAKSLALDPDRELSVLHQKLAMSQGGVLQLGDNTVTRLEELPADTVFGMKSERGHDGFWLEHLNALNSKRKHRVRVHLVQVKGGGRDMEIGCGVNPDATSGTLFTITKRLLTRSWPDVCELLKAAAKASHAKLELGTLVLVTTKHMRETHRTKFAGMKFKWNPSRVELRIVNNLEDVVPEPSRRFYT
jgi:hypothetical protein